MSVDTTQEQWLGLKVVCDLKAVEKVIDLFSRYGFKRHVVTVEEPLEEGEDDRFAVAPGKLVSVSSALSTEDMPFAELEQTRHSLWVVRQNLWAIGRSHAVSPLELFERQEEDWESTWKENFSLVRVTDRILSRPPWQQYEPRPGELVIEVDPGTAFGTGQHATTQQCIQALEAEIKPGDRVLDVGTGSGTLSVAAALLGAGTVNSLDIDPAAIRVARETAERNGVGDKVHVAFGSPGAECPFPGTFDIVLANIIAHIIIELAPALASATRPGGTLILGGIPDDKLELVREAFLAQNLIFDRETTLRGWSTFVFRQPESSAA